MFSKHFINDPTRLVADALRSLPALNPSVTIDEEQKVVRLIQFSNDDPVVSVISGGGSGHEPAFGAYVGRGLLTASIAGTIFASPSSRQIAYAIENVDSTKGILVTVMNYTGDVLNFGVAVEKAKAKNPSIQIELLVVGDDVGVPRSRAGKVGRRGIAGTVLVQKIVTALASSKYDLSHILQVGKIVCENLVSVGASLDHVHVPGRASEKNAVDELKMGEIELGMGIHNEPGSHRRSGQAADLPVLVAEMLKQLLDTSDFERAFLRDRSGEMVVLINNLGGLSVLELGAVTTEVVAQLRTSYEVSITRLYSGTFMTSLNGPGFSISLLNVVPTGLDKDMYELLDAPTEAVGWRVPTRQATLVRGSGPTSTTGQLQLERESQEKVRLTYDLAATVKSLRAGLEAVIAAEPEVTKYDTIVGDGDCGTTLRRGAEAITNAISDRSLNCVDFLSLITDIVESTMDGTSGALYSIFLNALTQYFRSNASKAMTVDNNFWTAALEHASSTLSRYTIAAKGDRTLVDALHPFVQTLRETSDVRQAAEASAEGAENTKAMRARLGRAVYVGREDEWIGLIPDPGAWGLSKFFSGLASSMEG